MSVMHAGYHPGCYMVGASGREDKFHAAVHLLETLLIGVVAAALTVGVWTMLSVATGFMNVFMAVLLGAVVGFTVNRCGRKWLHDYRGMAVILVLLGSLLGSVLAGLSLFSARVGVAFWQVVAARQLPEELPLLMKTFVESIEMDHLVFYAVALYLAYRLAGQAHEKTRGKI